VTPQGRTGAAWAVAIVGLLGWEAFVLSNGIPGDTLSETVWNASYATPLVPFLAGVLCGHFWFPKGKCVHCGQRPWAK
jgi:hypothetical protein